MAAFVIEDEEFNYPVGDTPNDDWLSSSQAGYADQAGIDHYWLLLSRGANWQYTAGGTIVPPTKIISDPDGIFGNVIQFHREVYSKALVNNPANNAGIEIRFNGTPGLPRGVNFKRSGSSTSDPPGSASYWTPESETHPAAYYYSAAWLQIPIAYASTRSAVFNQRDGGGELFYQDHSSSPTNPSLALQFERDGPIGTTASYVSCYVRGRAFHRPPGETDRTVYDYPYRTQFKQTSAGGFTVEPGEWFGFIVARSFDWHIDGRGSVKIWFWKYGDPAPTTSTPPDFNFSDKMTCSAEQYGPWGKIGVYSFSFANRDTAGFEWMLGLTQVLNFGRYITVEATPDSYTAGLQLTIDKMTGEVVAPSTSWTLESGGTPLNSQIFVPGISKDVDIVKVSGPDTFTSAVWKIDTSVQVDTDATLSIDATGLSDGVHDVFADVLDSADNVANISSPFLVQTNPTTGLSPVVTETFVGKTGTIWGQSPDQVSDERNVWLDLTELGHAAPSVVSDKLRFTAIGQLACIHLHDVIADKYKLTVQYNPGGTAEKGVLGVWWGSTAPKFVDVASNDIRGIGTIILAIPHRASTGYTFIERVGLEKEIDGAWLYESKRSRIYDSAFSLNNDLEMVIEFDFSIPSLRTIVTDATAEVLKQDDGWSSDSDVIPGGRVVGIFCKDIITTNWEISNFKLEKFQ